MVGRGRLIVVALLVGLIGFVGTLMWRRVGHDVPAVISSPFSGLPTTPEAATETAKPADESEKSNPPLQSAAALDQPSPSAGSAPVEVAASPATSQPANEAKPEIALATPPAPAAPSPTVTPGQTPARPTGMFFDPRDSKPEPATPTASAPEPPTVTPAAPPTGGGLFRDQRVITVPEVPRLAEGPSVTAPATAPAQKPLFQDARSLNENAAGDKQGQSSAPKFQDARIPAGSTGSGQGGAPKPQFQEDRTLPQTGLPPRALETTGPLVVPTPTPLPGFRDERTIAQPQFKDGRSTDSVRFTDQRAVPTSMFQDQRIAQERPAAAAEPAQQVARAPHVAPPESARAGGAEPGRTTIATIAPQEVSGIDLRTCGEPAIATEALSAGQMRIKIAARCKANEPVQIRYGGAEFVRQIDAFGTLDFVLDCFAGDTSVAELRFANGSRQALPVKALDLDRISKIAVTWRAPVNLDLHVFEYGAKIGTRGHLWAKLASSLQMAREASAKSGRGAGFLSVVDSDDSLGDKLEVYTFFHNDEQSAGTIALALDYETRGAAPAGPTCGDGELAEIEFRLTIMPRGGAPARQLGTLSRVDCGKPLSEAARFASSALPGLRIRR